MIIKFVVISNPYVFGNKNYDRLKLNTKIQFLPHVETINQIDRAII